jgi:hypothetical protein
MEDKNKFIDELLDSALAHQRKAVPCPGLEARIMERVRAASNQRPSGGELWNLSGKGWIAVAVTAAVVIIIVFARVADRQHAPAARTPQADNAVSTRASNKNLVASREASPSASTMATIISPKHPPPRQREQLRRIKAAHWPAQFPSPAPLSKEEKALIRYVQETPPQVLGASLLEQQSSTEAVEIKPLEIPPLEIQPLAAGATTWESQ